MLWGIGKRIPRRHPWCAGQVERHGARPGEGVEVSGDFQDSSASKAMSDAGGGPSTRSRHGWTTRGIARGLIFTPTVALADEMADAFREGRYPVRRRSTSTPTKEDRHKLIRDLRSGQGAGGSELRRLDGRLRRAVHRLASSSAPPDVVGGLLYTQMIGRGNPAVSLASRTAWVIDMVGANRPAQLGHDPQPVRHPRTS